MGAKAKGAKKAIHSVDTLAFTESLGLQTFRKGQRKTWVKQDDELLLSRLNELYPLQMRENTLMARSVDWDRVAEAFHGERKAKDCRKRWASSLDPNLRRGKWTPEEDELLMQQFKRHGASWQQVASRIEGRTEHQCSKRYYEVLDPNVRNRLQPWTEAEDLLLIDLVTCHGTKWKTIASEFAGRPSLTCRNRWRNLVTAVVRGRASAAVVEKMAGKFDGNLELLAEGSLPTVNGSVPPVSSVASAESVPSTIVGLPEEPMDLQAVSSSNPSPESELQHETAIHVASPVPQKGPWQEQANQAPSLVPAASSEWKYTLAGGQGVPENDPLRALLTFGGNIHSEQLANYLLQCAAQYNLQVNVHHHHHYPVLARGEGTTVNGNGNGNGSAAGTTMRAPVQPLQNDLPGFAALHQELSAHSPYFGSTPGPEFAPSPGPGMNTTSRFYSIEPEAQLSRFQHFNYLPPLTPVPKLQSSASSPAASSKGSTHHHHHHHHHHGPYAGTGPTREEGVAAENVPERDANMSKESDLLRLLNEGAVKRERSMEIDGVAGVDAGAETSRLINKPSHFEEESRSNSMTPLTQAVQMAAATDAASTAFYKRSAEEFAFSTAKRHHNNQHQNQNQNQNQNQHQHQHSHHPHNHHMGPEQEQNLEFFDPATDIHASQQNADKNDVKLQVPHSAYPVQQQQQQQQQQPVSQHHPLHYFTSNTSAPPEDMIDEEDEDFLSSWGMYSMRDKPQEPSEISDESNAWFPFNPS